MTKSKKKMTDARAEKILRDAVKTVEKGGYYVMTGQLKSSYVEIGVDRNAFIAVDTTAMDLIYLIHEDDLETGD